MKIRFCSISYPQVIVLALLMPAGIGIRAATISTCDEAGLRAAVNAGGTYTFECDGTIMVSSTLVVGNNLVLDGSGRRVTISGGGNARLFLVATGASLTVSHLTIADGNSTNGAAIYIDGGTVNLFDSTVSNNQSIASWPLNAEGGGVYNHAGVLNVSNTTFCLNVAHAYLGGPPVGGPWFNGLGGALFNDGGTVSVTASRFFGNTAQGSDGRFTITIGGGGADGSGGAIYNRGDLTVRLSTFATNAAIGGIGCDGDHMEAPDGGSGGVARGGAICNFGRCLLDANSFLANRACGGNSGQPVTASNGNGGRGGDGGQASGGAIYHGSNTLEVFACTFASNCLTSAAGSAGAIGFYAGPGTVGIGGNGGNGGQALGAGISALGGLVYVTNSTFANNLAQAGNAGAGGGGPIGGSGGNGGSAYAGALYVDAASATCVNDTFGWNSATAGLGGLGAQGTSGSGADGINGTAVGGLARISGSLALGNILVAFSSPINSSGPLVDLGHNISSDSSCNFTGSGSLNNINPSLLPLANNGGPTKTIALLAGSPAINGGDTSMGPTNDQRGVARPVGPASDIGAYEYDLAWTAPIVTVSFAANPVQPYAPVSLRIRIINPNASDLTSVCFTNAMPGAIAVAPAPNISNLCGAGSITAVVGSHVITGSGLSLAAGADCSVSVDVVISTPGDWISGDLTIASTETGLSYITPAIIRVEGSTTAVTKAAGSLLPNSVTLNGDVNPNGAATMAFFEWGLTMDLGNVTALQSAGNGFSNVPVSFTLTNLLPSTVYFYRAVATNSYGVSRGLTLSASTTGGVVTTNDEATLRANLAAGGRITFGFNGTISLSNTLVISRNTTLDGTNHLVVLSGNGAMRVFNVNPGITLTLMKLTIADGYSTNGAGIYNEGTLTLEDCIVSNNHVVGVTGIAGTNGPDGIVSLYPTPGCPGGNGTPGTPSCGGAIFNAHSAILSMRDTLLINNSAQGGTGGNGGNGGNGGYTLDDRGYCWYPQAAGAGGIGGNGGSAFGGALYNLGTAYLAAVEFATNQVRGGLGGNGGNAGINGCYYYFPEVPAGDAGTGGSSDGGAIYNLGLLQLANSSVAQNNSIGGEGGIGGGVNQPANPKPGGMGGAGNGGAIVNCGTNILVNVTLGLNCARGGEGGLGGCNYYYNGTVHLWSGNGGLGVGGALINKGYLWATNCTIWNNFSIGGLSTNFTLPSYSGTNGVGLAGTLDTTAAPGKLFLLNSLVGNLASASNCVGSISDGGYNLSSDGSCAFTGPGSLNNVDPQLGPFAYNSGPNSSFAPLPGSPALNAASPTEYPMTDQRGVPRPQGTRSDIGAVELQSSLSIQKVPMGWELDYHGSPNTTYTLQRSTQFSNWEDVETKVAGQDGLVIFTVPDPVPSAHYFFRIKFGP